MTVYRIHPVVTGTKVFDKGMMTYQHDYGKPFVIPVYVWYLEGGEHNILVDTGEMSPVRSPDREKAIGGPIHTFEEGLARWGLKPEEVDIVLHTHLHNDHCENDYKCVNARFYVHEKEMEHVHAPHPLDFRYLEDHIEEVEQDGRFELLAGDTRIAPGLRMIHTPAHTEGGMSIAVDTEEGLAVITGFCVIDENFNPPPAIRGMEMDVIPPGTVVDAYAAYDILRRVRALADVLIPLHEPRFAAIDTIG